MSFNPSTGGSQPAQQNEESMLNLSPEGSIQTSSSPLFTSQPFYKPFRYPWAYEAWEKQQSLHWLPGEVSMSDDIKDWKYALTKEEKHLLQNVFRFFTQMDVEVGGCYMDYYSRIFQPFEIKMMLTSFANMETIHVAAYSLLLDSVGMPEEEYHAFMKYKEMKDKWDYLRRFPRSDSLQDLARVVAVYGAFTEGLQLFASFAILMNFPRFNKMKGMGQIVTWSVRDETLHTISIIRLFKTIVKEHPWIMGDAFKADLVKICQEVVEHEDAFIDMAFETGGVEGITAQEVKDYIRYIANRRLDQLDLSPVYLDDKGCEIKNPLPWMDQILNGVEFTNFFENRATEYSKTTAGSWDTVF